jgi:hypothetical protein
MATTFQARSTVTEQGRNLLESLDLIYQHVGPDRFEAIGFNGRQLYHFDGSQLTPISLKQSVDWYVEIARLNDEMQEENWGESPQLKWLRLIAGAL